MTDIRIEQGLDNKYYIRATKEKELNRFLDDMEELLEDIKNNEMDQNHPIRRTALWKKFDKDIKPLMCDSDNTLFARLLAPLWHDLTCPCCAFFRGAFLAFIVSSLIALSV